MQAHFLDPLLAVGFVEALCTPSLQHSWRSKNKITKLLTYTKMDTSMTIC